MRDHRKSARCRRRSRRIGRPDKNRSAIALADDASVTAKGRVRQIDPQADPVTRTFKVRVAVNDPPPAMRLGATVSGRVEVNHGHGIFLPASALTATDKNPAVWVVDPTNLTVTLKPVEERWCFREASTAARSLSPQACMRSIRAKRLDRLE
jgi:multidrug efflux pump subunit AcrA (membrane-fusion protein)